MQECTFCEESEKSNYICDVCKHDIKKGITDLNELIKSYQKMIENNMKQHEKFMKVQEKLFQEQSESLNLSACDKFNIERPEDGAT